MKNRSKISKGREGAAEPGKAGQQTTPKKYRNEVKQEIEIKEVEEIIEMSQGRVGPQEYYKAPTPVYYMPPNTEAMKREAELAADITVGLAQVERLREEVHVTQLEVERLKTETRAIIAKLLSA